MDITTKHKINKEKTELYYKPIKSNGLDNSTQ
jgi:hypothetical protein